MPRLRGASGTARKFDAAASRRAFPFVRNIPIRIYESDHAQNGIGFAFPKASIRACNDN